MRNIFLLCFILFSKILLAQFAGGTYTIGTAGGENYSSLKAACDALNAAGSISGEVIFEITTDLIEPNNVALGVTTSGIPITFRPNADANRIVTFTQATKNVGPSGSFVIGTTTLADFTGLISTDNVVIDGYTAGGSTRRLTFQTSSTTAHINNSPITVIGNSNNVLIKNCIATHSPKAASGFPINFAIGLFTYYSAGTGTLTPDNITIDNCILTALGDYSAAFGTYWAGSTSLSVLPSNCVIKNNTITAGYSGINLLYCGAIDIYNNEFTINQTHSLASYGITINNTSKNSSGTSNIYNNNFIQLSSLATSSSYPSYYIYLVAHNGIHMNIYNNMMSGFSRSISSSSGTIGIYGIATAGADVNRNVIVVYNTILVNDIGSTGGTFEYIGILFNGNSEERISNNIISIQESSFDAFAMKQSNPNLSGEDPNSDYNLVYLGTGTAKWGISNSSYSTLASWQSATGFDSHSISKAVTFASASDLHLAGSSIGDIELIGTPVSGITTDIDGNTRNETYPYMGADENTASPLPVELTSFTATLTNSASTGSATAVVLNWTTATELNNYGFEIQRSVVSDQLTVISGQLSEWEKVGFVNGHGNSNSPNQYSFTDTSTPLSASRVFYRLKQIDTDGSLEYSEVVEVILNNLPTQFSLEQNYPNPFNPTTSIEYSVPGNEYVSLKVYDILGKEVATLVNENKSAGNYEVKFDASYLSSGVYFYKIEAGSFVSVKKLLLMK